MNVRNRTYITRKYVYVSFDDKDRIPATHLIDMLDACEFNVSFSILKRKNEPIDRTIDRCSCFIMLKSKHSDNSEYCAYELERARNAGIRIITAEIDADEKKYALDGRSFESRDALYNALVYTPDLKICSNEPTLLDDPEHGMRIKIDRGFVFINDFEEEHTGWEKSIYLNGNSFEGYVVNDSYEGYGVYLHKFGTIYEGDWHEDKCSGYGVQYYEKDPWTGDKYEGEWFYDKQYGFGRYTRANGEYFEGEWMYGNSYKGKYVWPDGRCYEGEMNKECADGHGTMTYPGGRKATGEWRNGVMCLFMGKDRRRIKKYFWDGGIYEGEHKDYMRDGMGKQYYPDGSIYIGSWRDNKREGFGLFISYYGAAYRGMWKNDKKEGAGQERWKNGRIIRGKWEEDALVGTVNVHDEKGNVYLGEYNYGYEGFGVMQYANGDVYTGEWRDDKRCGKGTMIYADGHTVSGKWIDDVLQSE